MHRDDINGTFGGAVLWSKWSGHIVCGNSPIVSIFNLMLWCDILIFWAPRVCEPLNANHRWKEIHHDYSQSDVRAIEGRSTWTRYFLIVALFVSRLHLLLCAIENKNIPAQMVCCRSHGLSYYCCTNWRTHGRQNRKTHRAVASMKNLCALKAMSAILQKHKNVTSGRVSSLCQ